MWRPILIRFVPSCWWLKGRSYKARISMGINGRWTLDALPTAHSTAARNRLVSTSPFVVVVNVVAMRDVKRFLIPICVISTSGPSFCVLQIPLARWRFSHLFPDLQISRWADDAHRAQPSPFSFGRPCSSALQF